MYFYLCPVAELKALQDNRSQMQQIFDTQEFSPADVDRIKQEYQEIQRQISSEERMMEKLDSDVWALELGIAKSREQVGLLVKVHQNTDLISFSLQGFSLRLFTISVKFICGTWTVHFSL